MYRYVILFLLAQAFLPACSLLGFLTGREFVLSSDVLFLLVLITGTVFLTLCICKSKKTKAVILALPLSILNALTMLLTLPWYGGLGVVTVVVCGWIVSSTSPKSVWKILCMILSALLTLGMSMILPIWLFAVSIGRNTVVMELDSPDGRYTAIVTDSDQGALGGDTLVDVRDNDKTVDILIGKFFSHQRVYHGDWGEWQDMTLSWQDGDTLVINGTACSVSDADISIINSIAGELDVSIRNGELLEYSDTHGGFLGDGSTSVKIRCTAEIPKSKYWHSLPLTENLSNALYGGNHHSSFFRDLHIEPTIPQMENGYYFFYDRHNQSTDPSDDSLLYSRHSYNFTLALYDSSTQTLYYFKLDT